MVRFSSWQKEPGDHLFSAPPSPILSGRLYCDITIVKRKGHKATSCPRSVEPSILGLFYDFRCPKKEVDIICLRLHHRQVTLEGSMLTSLWSRKKVTSIMTQFFWTIDICIYDRLGAQQVSTKLRQPCSLPGSRSSGRVVKDYYSFTTTHLVGGPEEHTGANKCYQ